MVTLDYDQIMKLLKKLLNRLRNRFLAKRGGNDQDPYNYPLFQVSGWRAMRVFRLRWAMMTCVKA